MGCFSFLCKVTQEPILSSSFDGDAVHLFLLKDGKVIEKMYGNYNSYGRVFGLTKHPDDNSLTDATSLNWDMDWGDVCDLMFHKDRSNGIAAVLDVVWDGEIPTTRSEQDPNQGWGVHPAHFKKEMGGRQIGKKVRNPYHNIYTKV